MLNVLGKVLGAAMPDPWKREQIADAQRYNFDWETLEAQFGQNPANPNYMASPDTYQDYVIKRQEMGLKGGSKLFGSSTGSKYTVPAIKPSKFGKAAGAIGGAVSSVFALQIGFSIGNGIDQAMGIDSTGLVCSSGSASGLLALATGVDCGAYDNAMTTLQQNADAGTAGVTGGKSCLAGHPTDCVQATARALAAPTFYTCFTAGSSPDSVPLAFQTEADLGTNNWHTAVVNPAQSLDVSWGCPTGTNYIGGDNPQAYCAVSGNSCDPSQVQTITDASADPDRVLHCSVTGTDGQTYTQDSAPFKESDGTLAGPSCPVLPDGVYPQHQTVTENGGGVSNQLSDQTMTPESLAQLGDYPECNTGACKLDLIDHLHGDKSCFDEAAVCDGWFADPTKADDYQCRFGIHDVEQQNCFVYSGVFNAGRQQIGAPYSDPLTGTWSGGQNAPSEGGTAYQQTIQNPDTSVRDCLGTASTTFDPIAWVMRPVQCALEWAFVPRAAVVQLEGANVATAWGATIFGQIGPLMNQFSGLPIFTGCDGLPIDMDITWPINWGIHWTLGAACSGPMATGATVVRSVVGGVISIAAVLAFIRYISNAIGFSGFGRAQRGGND